MNRREFVAMAPAFPAAAVTASLTLRADGQEPVEVAVSVLKLEPGDILVFRTSERISAETAERLRDSFESQFPAHRALVLGDGLSLEGVLRA